jgi:hypothetical protein
MQTKPDLGNGTQPVYQDGGEIRCDSGRRVIIHSVGGALRGASGTVEDGPYHLVYRAMSRKVGKKGKDGKIKSTQTTIKTDPYWLVRIDDTGFYIHFAESEITFV